MEHCENKWRMETDGHNMERRIPVQKTRRENVCVKNISQGKLQRQTEIQKKSY